MTQSTIFEKIFIIKLYIIYYLLNHKTKKKSLTLELVLRVYFYNTKIIILHT